MASTEAGKRKAKPGETPSPMDYKKINMGEKSVPVSDPFAENEALFGEENLTIIEVDGKTDRQLLEGICERLNNMTLELHQVNRKQDEILNRVKIVENQVLGHEVEIQDIKQSQTNVEEKLSQLVIK